MGLVILLVMLAGIVVYFMAIYNDLVGARNGCKNAFEPIAVQLAQRHQRMANLVASMQGCAAGEKSTLDRVMAARDAAAEVLARTRLHLGAPSAVQQLSTSETQVAQALDELFALIGAAQVTREVQQLIDELACDDTGPLALARKAFNAAVMDYNRRRAGFPNALIAGLFDFLPARLLEIEMPRQRATPKRTFA